jgi:hypothetical protein
LNPIKTNKEVEEVKKVSDKRNKKIEKKKVWNQGLKSTTPATCRPKAAPGKLN